MYDIIIRNGTLIDGTGAAAVTADVAITGSTISAIGNHIDPTQIAANTHDIDASGKLVTPGFVDIHTHYDGQATWDSQLAPSIYNGVTTVVMGNCGVGFAPVKPHQRDWLISLMEGVEDIPGTALAEGIDWQWESFPEFLDSLDSKAHMIDIVAQLPHGALRTYVMGERGGDHLEKPTSAEIAQMAQLAEDAVNAGAIGFTTSRTVNHKTADGEHTPSLSATAEELWGIAEGLKRANKGVIQLVCDFENHDAEFALIRDMAKRSGRPLSVTLNQDPAKPDEWKTTLDCISQANSEGIKLTAQVAPRPVGVLLSLQSTYHPFIMCPAFQNIAGQPLAQQLEQLKNADYRATLVNQYPAHPLFDLEQTFVMDNIPNYEPDTSESIASLAASQSIPPAQLALEAMMADQGRGMLYFPALNFAAGNSDISHDMLTHPHTVPGLGDGGAHVSFISDASFCTYLLTHWARDRERGKRIPLEYLIKSQTRDTAEVVGLFDRGLIASGLKADINIIDFDKLAILKPDMVNDLPAGGNRLVQRTTGYETMIVSGQVVMQNGQATGSTPGQLVRGSQGKH